MKNRPENRLIRIFISSTFEDMKAERDYLITKVFPKLAAKAAERDVTLIPLDLRWGISEEESKTGKVVEICLQEIEQSRPFFIGLLGNRYGWCPSMEELEKNTLLRERYGWIEDDIVHGLSVTEMEIQYGVLRNPDKIDAYFYIRKENDNKNPDNSDNSNYDNPGNSRKNTFGGIFRIFRNLWIFGNSAKAETQSYDNKRENLSESEENQKSGKLHRLKNSVRNNGRYPVNEYESVEELGKKAENAFNRLLDSRYPENKLSELERERLSQSSFLHSRCDTYIPQKEAMNRLNRFIQHADEHTIVVTGESGMGKSSLIANWLLSAMSLKNDNKSCKHKIIYHFLGNGGTESDFSKIAERLCNEIRDLYNIGEDESDKSYATENSGQSGNISATAYMKELDTLYSKISGQEQLLIVLDGINQLSDRENAKQLLWLPPASKNVKYLFSTLPDDRTMDVFKRRKYPVLELFPMKREDRIELVNLYLKRYGKKLTPKQVESIVTSEQCKNTLVLRTLLDELINFGSYELLDKRIEHYLKSSSTKIFFNKVIKRFEADFEETLTRRLLSLIAFSRSGLSEQEILSISGVSTYHWSQFYCAFRFNLTTRAGLLTFSHGYISDAVISAYNENETATRKEIIQFFLNSDTTRAYDELPYQMYHTDDAEALYNLLLKLAVTDHIFKKDKHELSRYWRYLLETDSDRFSPEKYFSMKVDEAAKVGCFYEMCYIFSKEIINTALAKKFLENAILVYKNCRSNNKGTFAIFYRLAGDIYSAEGDYTKALEYHNMVLEIKKSIYGENSIRTAHAYNNAGLIYYMQNNYEKALEFYQTALKIYNSNPDISKADIPVLYDNLGSLYTNMHQYDSAQEYSKKALDLTLAQYGKNDLSTATCYNNLATSYNYAGKVLKAAELYGEALKIYVTLLGEDHPHVAKIYSSLGAVSNNTGHYDKGRKYSIKAIEILKETYGEIHPDIAFAGINLASSYYLTANYDESIECTLNALKIYGKLQIHETQEVAKCYHSLSSCYIEKKEFEPALKYEKMAFDIYNKIFDENNLCIGECYNNMGAIYNYTGRHTEADESYAKALKIYINTYGENHHEIAKCYNNIGHNLSNMQDYEKAIDCYSKAMDIYNNMESETTGPDLAICCNNLGLACYNLHEYDNAITCYGNAIKILKKLNLEIHGITGTCYYNMGTAYLAKGMTDEADINFDKSQKINHTVFGPEHQTVKTLDQYIRQMREMYRKDQQTQ